MAQAVPLPPPAACAEGVEDAHAVALLEAEGSAVQVLATEAQAVAVAAGDSDARAVGEGEEEADFEGSAVVRMGEGTALGDEDSEGVAL